jgi:hypothetical protein
MTNCLGLRNWLRRKPINSSQNLNGDSPRRHVVDAGTANSRLAGPSSLRKSVLRSGGISYAVMANKVVVVVASADDRVARGFAARHAADGACLLTPNDLSQAGWRQSPGDIAMSAAVVAGRLLATRDIAGIVIRLPAVLDRDRHNFTFTLLV